MQTRIITLCGLPGSGKSSTARGVAEALGYRHFSSGDLFRAMAKERGISIEEINHRAELESEIDHAVDGRLREMKSETDLVIDSRTAFHWIPKSFKVFLKVDPRVAAERTFAHMQEGGRISQDAASAEEVYQKTLARTASEIKRYNLLYSVNYTDENHFDLVIDTTKHPLDEVVRMIVEAYKKRL